MVLWVSTKPKFKDLWVLHFFSWNVGSSLFDQHCYFSEEIILFALSLHKTPCYIGEKLVRWMYHYQYMKPIRFPTTLDSYELIVCYIYQWSVRNIIFKYKYHFHLHIQVTLVYMVKFKALLWFLLTIELNSIARIFYLKNINLKDNFQLYEFFCDCMLYA